MFVLSVFIGVLAIAIIHVNRRESENYFVWMAAAFLVPLIAVSLDMFLEDIKEDES